MKPTSRWRAGSSPSLAKRHAQASATRSGVPRIPLCSEPSPKGEENLAHRTLDARPVHLMLAGNLLRQNPSTLQQTRQTVQIRDGECGLRRLDVPPAVDEHRVDPYLRRTSDVRDRIVAHVDRTLPPDTADSQRLLEDSRVWLLDPHNPGGDHAVEVPHPAEVLEHLDEQDVPVRDYVGLEPHLPQPAQHGLRLWVGDQGGPALRHFY